MQQLKALFANAKREVVIGSAALVATVSNVSMAGEGDIDISKALLYVGGGLVAAAALTAAMLGLVALIGVGKKSQRAGT